MLTVVLPLPVMDAGLKLQLLAFGSPVHELAAKSMVPLYPASPVAVSETDPLCPLF